MRTQLTDFSPMSLTTRLITLRKENKLTQQAMAQTIGIHVNSLKKYEAEPGSTFVGRVKENIKSHARQYRLLAI